MRDHIRSLVLLLALLTGLAVTAVAVPAAETEAGEKRKLTITVVEDIPAMDIEENEVPLAALPEGRAKSGDVTVPVAVASGLLLLGGAELYRRRRSRRTREAILQAFYRNR